MKEAGKLTKGFIFILLTITVFVSISVSTFALQGQELKTEPAEHVLYASSNVQESEFSQKTCRMSYIKRQTPSFFTDHGTVLEENCKSSTSMYFSFTLLFIIISVFLLMFIVEYVHENDGKKRCICRM